MEIQTVRKESFAVIGKEGSTKDGSEFIKKLWSEANSHFDEVAHLAVKNSDGKPVGFWGAMTDFSRSFKPWQNDFSQGLYLAGVEVSLEAVAPKGWVKWIIPSFEYLKVKSEGGSTFIQMIEYLHDNNIELAGAVNDFTDPSTGLSYMLFPTKRIPAASQIETYCGLSCLSCEFKTSMNCGGCIETRGNPFHVTKDNPCAIAECVKAKQAAGVDITSCGECKQFPCDVLKSYSNDPEHGDNPKGARIENCRKLAVAKK